MSAMRSAFRRAASVRRQLTGTFATRSGRCRVRGVALLAPLTPPTRGGDRRLLNVSATASQRSSVFDTAAAALLAASVAAASATGVRSDDAPSATEYRPVSEEGVNIARKIQDKIKSPDDLQITLYQYQTCPFCNKVRAFLDYHRLPYSVVEVNPMRKDELKWSSYRKVPVVMVNGEQLNGSTEIICSLSCLLVGSGDIAQLFSTDEKKWLKWLDQYFVHLLPPNIYRTASESMQTFDYLTTEGNFSWWQRESARYFGAAAMYLVAKRLKKKYNVGEPREDLYNAVNKWMDAVENNGKFLGGASPSLADVAVFGVLRSLISFDTYDDMMNNTRVRDWYARMQREVGESARLPEGHNVVPAPIDTKSEKDVAASAKTVTA